jgi:hypothetical protein
MVGIGDHPSLVKGAAMRVTLQVLLVLLVALLALTGCRSAGVVDGDESSAQEPTIVRADGSATVPFHASIENTVELVPPFPPPIINAIFTGKTRTRPFGFADFVGISQVDSTVLPNAQTTDFTVTYRNGDELHYTSAGIAIPDAMGNSDFSGDYTIIGGTGRFANATGSGTYAGRFDAATNTGRWTMDGVIAGFGGPGSGEGQIDG